MCPLSKERNQYYVNRQPLRSFFLLSDIGNRQSVDRWLVKPRFIGSGSISISKLNHVRIRDGRSKVISPPKNETFDFTKKRDNNLTVCS